MDNNNTLSEDIISKLGTETELEIFSQENIFGETEDDADDIIILHMDIQEPLSSLRPILEQKMGQSLKKFSFWLQNAQILEPHKNLVDQCVEGDGLVQINVQVHIINQIINIVDVLKPTEEALAELNNKTSIDHDLKNKENNLNNIEEDDYIDETDDNEEYEKETIAEEIPKKGHVRNWVIDKKFRKKQTRLNIPDDPNDWSIPHVKHWLTWAVRTFNLQNISINNWNITGCKLCSLTLEEFHQKVPHDPNNLFWTHIELLRKCKFVTIQQNLPPVSENNEVKLDKSLINSNNTITMPYSEPYASRSGNNGQIQLWQFLLDILTDPEHLDIIGWIGNEGEFKFIEPEIVAQLWGVRKNKPAMNYEKLSRALRYYYDGDMISKVTGKRYVYKFVCDLKQLMGYDARELSAAVRSARTC